MFENSLRIVDDCGLTYLHVFPFSPRPGTPAARMPQLEKSLIKERAARLRQHKSILDSVNEKLTSLRNELGATDRVKVEQYTEAVRDLERRGDLMCLRQRQGRSARA